jgi:hypothetical protein
LTKIEQGLGLLQTSDLPAEEAGQDVTRRRARS